MAIVLHQFIRSHFNEKVRWTLDYKGIAHTRETYLPGPHIPLLQHLSGKTHTPVLDLDGEILTNSATIIDALETRFPDPPLYPSDEAGCAEALAFAAACDESTGPAVRAAIFSVLLEETDYLGAVFGDNKPRWKQAAYRATLPAARGMIAKGNGIHGPEDIERAFATTEAALDDLAKRVAGTGYVCGDSFTVADLTAAALFAPISDVDHPDMTLPSPRPDAISEVLARFAGHPTVAWVRSMYEGHRPNPR